MQQPPAYRQAVSEFDRLWECGESRRQERRMQELLLVIEAFENTPAGQSSARHLPAQGAKQ
jgi:hypothetical protein